MRARHNPTLPSRMVMSDIKTSCIIIDDQPKHLADAQHCSIYSTGIQSVRVDNLVCVIQGCHPELFSSLATQVMKDSCGVLCGALYHERCLCPCRHQPDRVHHLVKIVLGECLCYFLWVHLSSQNSGICDILFTRAKNHSSRCCPQRGG